VLQSRFPSFPCRNTFHVFPYDGVFLRLSDLAAESGGLFLLYSPRLLYRRDYLAGHSLDALARVCGSCQVFKEDTQLKRGPGSMFRIIPV